MLDPVPEPARPAARLTNPATAMIRIAIVDDHAIVRGGLRSYFADHADLQVVAEASDGRQALDIARKGDVDVMLLDLAMPEHGGIDALSAIKVRAPRLPVLVLSGFPAEHYATAALRKGARGYLDKTCDPEQIVDAIRVVSQGRKYITPNVAELLAATLDRNEERPAHDALTEREFQVFLRLAQGETMRQMADGMCLSTKTIGAYRTRVKGKLCASANSDLTYYALKFGLIQ
jgi:two-component system invasion response regulator UvrY